MFKLTLRGGFTWGLSLKHARSFSTPAGRLAGKVALITGAASGIGKTTAKEFIKHGAKVVIADIQQEIGQQTATELGPNATFTTCDVTQEPHLSNAVDFAVSQHGRLDIMYNNAGISGSAAFSNIADLDLAEFDRVMIVNARGVIAGIKHAARVMVPRRSGCILCTASVCGMAGGLAKHPYTVSKFTIIGIVKSASSELCKHGIRINCISPFAIPTTPLVLDTMTELFPAATADGVAKIIHSAGELEGAVCEEKDIARAALYLASDDAKYISGHNLVVDGGFTSSKRFGFSDIDQ
uniref:Secoisolariciresinol dehydrogenase 6 n=1 Tax=Kadsura heteroclita TaxID=124781 RepID=A0A7U3VIB2_9MAGN|nr:secoisolariciresinol dehydrogenase 6 [Kadsura heteroclita]